MLHSVCVCRTAEAGAHLHQCEVCGHTEQAYNSCRDRHCPTCQYPRQREWVAKRLDRMLPAPHFHVVFTLPSELRPLAAFNPEVVYDRLMKAAARTLQALAEDRLGMRLGITVVLHTWTRDMLRHPHVHCIVSAGGMSLEHGGWKAIDRPFLFPAAVMKKLFRGKLLAMLKAADRAAPLQVPDGQPLRKLLAPLYLCDWVVYAKAPLPSQRHLVRYLGAYTHRVAISNSRILALGRDTITFRGTKGRVVTVDDDEFIRRFLLHVLPSGFRKIRHYGLYAPSNAAKVDALGSDCLEQLDDLPPSPGETTDTPYEERCCPVCRKGPMTFVCATFGVPYLDSS